MSKWGLFEDKCFHYLKATYGTDIVTFESEGKSNSAAPDVKVLIGGRHAFNMETKMANAQCGQFVLFPNEAKRQFEYSRGNAYQINSDSRAIMIYMDNLFDTFCVAGSRGQAITLDKAILYSWIKNYYKSKGVQFFVSEWQGRIVIFPIDKMEDYFNVSAIYRMKKSGSTSPSPSNNTEILGLVNDPTANIYTDSGKVFVSTTKNLTDTILKGDKYSYIFRFAGSGTYMIRRLSNTFNSNVIFSISLKKGQDAADLELFLQAIKKPNS